MTDGFFRIALAMAILWRSKKLPVAVLCLTPFLIAAMAAWLHMYPYGRSRHTAILSLFAAAGTGIAVDRFLQTRYSWIVKAAGPILLLAAAVHVYPKISHLRQVQRREAMIAAVDYVREAVPPGQALLADRKTAFLLNYYFCGERMAGPNSTLTFKEMDICGYRIHAGDWSHSSAAFGDRLADFRKTYGIQWGQPVWVADFGFELSVLEELLKVPETFSIIEPRRFTGSAALFRIAETSKP